MYLEVCKSREAGKSTTWIVENIQVVPYKQDGYFLMFPPIFSQWRGEALSRGEREIRDEVSFQASDRLKKVTKKL
jgi:hypothetical protein